MAVVLKDVAESICVRPCIRGFKQILIKFKIHLKTERVTPY